MQDVNSQQCCKLANHFKFSEGQQYAEKKGQKRGQVYFQIKSDDVTFLEIQKMIWDGSLFGLFWDTSKEGEIKKRKEKEGFAGIRPKEEEKRAEEAVWQLLQSITFYQMKVNTQWNEGKHSIKWRHTIDQNLSNEIKHSIKFYQKKYSIIFLRIKVHSLLHDETYSMK